MSDYKELLKTLRGICSVKDYEPCEYNLQAADAIEQLMNDYEILAKMYAKANEDLCVRTKERGTAVRHGHWVGDGFDKCSVCGSFELGRSAYCPRCGARMDEVSK